MMTQQTIQAIDLKPEHLGRRITVPVGLETRDLLLSTLNFRRYEGSVRVTVRGPAGTRDYYDLAAYAKITLED